MPHGYGVVVHGADNLCRAFITRLYPHRAVRPLLWARYRGHICEMAAGVKAEHEIIVYYGKLGIIKKSPTYEVGERQVAVLPLAPKSKALYKGLVGYGNILELYHIGNMLDFYIGKNIKKRGRGTMKRRKIYTPGPIAAPWRKEYRGRTHARACAAACRHALKLGGNNQCINVTAYLLNLLNNVSPTLHRAF